MEKEKTSTRQIVSIGRSEIDQIHALWESCFRDSKEYMEFYETWKVGNNRILGIFDEERLVSMIHLNPYELRIRGKLFSSYYIVGVATDSLYRKRGLMRSLMLSSFENMYEQQQPITYLMPAKESIYLPFDFRTVTEQVRSSIPLFELNLKVPQPELSAASLKATQSPGSIGIQAQEGEKYYEAMARFANEQMQQEYEIYTERNAYYYRRMLEELIACNGGIQLLVEDSQVQGYVSYAIEGYKLEILECICEASKRELLLQELYETVLQKVSEEEMEASRGVSASVSPTIMVRIIHLPNFLKQLRAKIRINLCIKVLDQWIPDNEGIYELHVGPSECTVTKHSSESYDECSLDFTCDVADLASLCFGMLSKEEQTEKLTWNHTSVEHRIQQLSPFRNVYINEIV